MDRRPDGQCREDERRNNERRAVSLFSGIGVGIAIGAGIGVALDNIALGIGIGLAIGGALGGGIAGLDGRRSGR